MCIVSSGGFVTMCIRGSMTCISSRMGFSFFS